MLKKRGLHALLLGVVGCTIALSGCDRSLEARLEDAAGLEEDAPVYFAGVRVGQVDSVRINGERADIELTVESSHDVTLHRDACAVAGRYQETPALLLFSEVPAYCDMGLLPGGLHRNRKHYAPHLKLEDGLPLSFSDIACDPQTSGGLLFALGDDDAKKLLDRLNREGISAALIGEVIRDEREIILLK